MLSGTAASAHAAQEISQHVLTAEHEYKLAKQELDGVLQTLRTCSDGMAGMEDSSLVRQLVEREQRAISGVAEALQALYDHNERWQKQGRQSTLCA